MNEALIQFLAGSIFLGIGIALLVWGQNSATATHFADEGIAARTEALARWLFFWRSADPHTNFRRTSLAVRISGVVMILSGLGLVTLAVLLILWPE
jgi:hypothetical protein